MLQVGIEQEKEGKRILSFLPETMVEVLGQEIKVGAK
jgi:L-lactate utilization protein LutC